MKNTVGIKPIFPIFPEEGGGVFELYFPDI